ncbi:glycosyltransferase [Microbulbifer agarilyticus]|uniref:glycosyltransferase n=1 Tax=Microbulbifer agarilyticus TaxID=260552 RepID=UPI001C94D9CA|nr:glycosyltransferase [Microbulbifer agarilyticus]MBY6189171.1 glycosyltransferase [Microbulbifer agarilyticus]
MNVLQCYRTFFPESQGGLEQVVLEVAAGTDGEVLTLADQSVAGGMVNGVAYTAAKRWFSIASCCVGLGFVSHLVKKKADILHFHFPWPFGDLSYLIGGLSRPLIITYHSDIVRQRFLGALYRPLMRAFLNRADRIVATSENYLESSDVLAAHRSKVEVIPLGISEEGYPRPSDDQIRQVKEKHGTDFMLFVGVLRYYKGLEFLIRAAASEPYNVVIAGEGPERRRLENLAKTLGAKNVKFVGRISDEEKMALMQLCRAVVFPSHLRSEAFGVTLLEGMMSTKPLVSCELGTGTSYVNQHEVTGLVIPPADVQALRSAMAALWSDTDMARKMGLAARRRFEEEFTSAKMVSAYKDLYCRVLSEREGLDNG